ncbi:pyridoxal phosphate-dependent aminotransferase [Paenibacillus sp. TRM 82003]|nr:pyridoxal phosphate-dependent aminotransferase [Kineococcus sp. TRM81007]MCI2238252.1 pyridoxal phosphate-dependent aminotransferase [Kineococcus sp. TRM81007]MCI3924076.1 pyridoxal phosphate-dependent aminotransferase [Paenibacillus sp. TRM 82003]
MVHLGQSSKLADVLYDVRGPALTRATELEQAGHRVLKLNIGNPAPFGFDAPPELLEDIVANLPVAQGYSDSKGLLSARRAVVQHTEAKGVAGVDVDGVYMGNGVSELIVMAMQALLDEGDEVLVPAPDYPLWTAAVSLAGGRPVHYLCDESADWMPDVEHLRSKVSERTKAVVVINPNNPTGAVYGTEVLQDILGVAREHGLLVLSDEIYEKILYDGATHVSTAALAPDLMCLTFNGLSKAYRVAGFRSGWMVVSGPTGHARGYIEGLDLLANMRLCANVPAQHAVQAALGGHQSINDLVLPGGRLAEQSKRTWELLNEIPGVSCVRPRGALYCFPRLDPEVHRVDDDYQLILDLLEQQHVFVVQGTGFNWPKPDHFRIVTLPRVEDLEMAVGRIAEFLGDRARG